MIGLFCTGTSAEVQLLKTLTLPMCSGLKLYDFCFLRGPAVFEPPQTSLHDSLGRLRLLDSERQQKYRCFCTFSEACPNQHSSLAFVFRFGG